MPFTFERLAILDVVLVRSRVFPDERGHFLETFKASDFARAGIPTQFPQENHSVSTRAGVLRGLHYQMDPMAQGKLVRCLEGEVFDVAVDLRKGSPTYGRHVAAVLRASEGTMLWIPEGFAHGFCTITARADVSYSCTREYSPPHERSIVWDDPDLAIPWPTRDVTLAKKDVIAPRLRDADNGFVWGPAR